MSSKIRVFVLIMVIAQLLIWVALLDGYQFRLHILPGLLLVLVLPGYALSYALLGIDRLDRIERAAISLGLSLMLTVMGGLLLNVLPWKLSPATWLVWTTVITLHASVAAIIRVSMQNAATCRRASSRRWQLRRGELALVLLAGMLVVSAYAVARVGAELQRSTFTQFWMLPAVGSEQPAVRLGIANTEGRTMQYQLQVFTDDERFIWRRRVALEAGHRWETTILIPSELTEVEQGTRLEGRLFQVGLPENSYRQTRLWLPNLADRNEKYP